MFGALAHAGDQAHGHSHAHGAGAGDDEDGHGRDHSKGQRLAGAKVEPGQESDDGDDHHGGHEVAGHHVHQPGNGRFGTHRVLYHLHDLGQGGVFAHLGGPEFEGAGGVHRRPNDFVADNLIYGHTFAGDHGFINGGTAVNDLAVYRNLIARAHHNHVAHQHFLDRNLDFLAVPQHAGRFGLQIQQLADGLAGLSFGPHFQRLA